LFVFLFLGVLGSGEAYAAVCDDGRSVPPYVGTDAVDPNVLLMIDNSASMNDLAAVGSTGICYDGPDDAGGGYNSSNNYPGYFRPYVDPDDPAIDPYLEDAWYSYDLVDGRFEKMLDTNNDQDNEPEARALCGTTGKVFSGDDVCVKYNPEYTGPGDTDPPVLAFAARGNFLNWLSASKFDIQKKVLTGGKVYESNNELELIMESRGCLNHRYVKKTVGVDLTGDITGLGANSEAYLTLGIRIPAEWQNGISYPANSIVVTPPGCREDNTVECVGYYTSAGGTSSGTSPQNDSVTWEERDYADLTQIEVFKVTTTGFDVSGCELAIAEMAKPSPNLGQIKADIDVCLETVGGLLLVHAKALGSLGYHG
jgi:type IV pilus assembly protein PilY1